MSTGMMFDPVGLSPRSRPDAVATMVIRTLNILFFVFSHGILSAQTYTYWHQIRNKLPIHIQECMSEVDDPSNDHEDEEGNVGCADIKQLGEIEISSTMGGNSLVHHSSN